MEIVLGGKFEISIIRELDKFNRPGRNNTSHSYYMGLNRRTDSSYFHRAATFIMISNKIVVPEVDWSERPAVEAEGINGNDIGISLIQEEQQSDVRLREWDDKHKNLAEKILDAGLLSRESLAHISTFSFSDIPPERRFEIELRKLEIEIEIARHYLCRLFLQLRVTQGSKYFLVLDEHDVNVLSEIADFLNANPSHATFDFPDLTGKVILGHDFCGGLLNFSPPDAASLVAVKSDPTIEKYASTIRNSIGDLPSHDSQRSILKAMVDTYRDCKDYRRVETAFEIAGWIAKPLHYIPGVDAFLSVTEDAKDVVDKALGRGIKSKEWHLIAAKAQAIAIEEYIDRKHNL